MMLEDKCYPIPKTAEELEHESEDRLWERFKFPKMRIRRCEYMDGLIQYTPQVKRWFMWNSIQNERSFMNSNFSEYWFWNTDLTEKNCNYIIRAYKRWIAHKKSNKCYITEILNPE